MRLSASEKALATQRMNGPFSYVVFLVPLLLMLPWVSVRLLGFAGLCWIVKRGWRWIRLDPVLLSFLAFCLFIEAAYDYAGRHLREQVIPYTGWLPTAPYGACVFFAILALWSGIKKLRLAPVALLLLQVGWGVWEWASCGSHESANPYLNISEWRPVWTVGVPLAWAMLVAGRAPKQPAGIDVGEPPPNNEMQLTSPG